MKVTFITVTSLATLPPVAAFMASRSDKVSSKPLESSIAIEADSNSQQPRPLYDPLGLYPKNADERKEGRIQSLEALLFNSNDDNTMEEGIVSLKNSRAIYDPLRLYPKDCVERKEGRIKGLEPTLITKKAVLDPMGLYPKDTPTDDYLEKSVALPFTVRPSVLSGDMPGDVGFDPLGLASSDTKLLEYREAEIKHSRLAMLAAAGWPLSELWDKQVASIFHMKPLLEAGDRVPSLLNGGLDKVNPFYWGAVLAMASCIEVFGMIRGSRDSPGDLGFDPLGLYPEEKDGQDRMQLAEIKNGRVAMVAVTLFALEEAITKNGIVDQTPFFFRAFHL